MVRRGAFANFSTFALAIALSAIQSLNSQAQTALNGDEIAPYGKSCRAALGKLPDTWSCHDPNNGQLLDVGPFDSQGKCTRPPWLTLDNAPPTTPATPTTPAVVHRGEQCINGTRLLKLTTTKSDTDVRVICRRYASRADNDIFYEDVAVVAHNTTSGDTCFFQALAIAQPNRQLLNGTDVPSPMADPADPAESALAQRAKEFWMAPKKLNNGALKCTLCHDNGAWMHTPYVDQHSDKDVPHYVPDIWDLDAISVPNKYQLVEKDFFLGANSTAQWPEPKAVITAMIKDGNNYVNSQECTRCHRISDANTKDEWLDWSTSNPNLPPNNPIKIPGERTDLPDWADYRWMATDNVYTDETDWLDHYGKHLKAMHCCLENPKWLGCAQIPSLGIKVGDKPVWGTSDNGICVNDTGEVPFHVEIDSKVVSGRDSSDTSCSAPLSQPAISTYQYARQTPNGLTTISLTTPPGGTIQGYKVPFDPTYNPDTDLFPGDKVEITLQNLTAWDSGRHLLQFDRWTGTNSSTLVRAKSCPCEDPTSSTCKFTTLGATNWFGKNPDAPQYHGDPPKFQCIARFKSVGDCSSTSSTSTASTATAVTGQGHFSNTGSNMAYTVSFSGLIASYTIVLPSGYMIGAWGMPNNFICNLFVTSASLPAGQFDSMICSYTGSGSGLPGNTTVSYAFGTNPDLPPDVGAELYFQPSSAQTVGPVKMTGP